MFVRAYVRHRRDYGGGCGGYGRDSTLQKGYYVAQCLQHNSFVIVIEAKERDVLLNLQKKISFAVI